MPEARLAPAPDYNRQVHYRAVCGANAGPAPPCRNLWTATDDKMMSPFTGRFCSALPDGPGARSAYRSRWCMSPVRALARPAL